MCSFVRLAAKVAASLGVLLVGFACGGAKTAGTSASGSGGAAAADYHTSACGTCVENTACTGPLSACGADPSCAAYLNCLNACPLGANGDVDPKCELACPPVTSSAGQTAKAAFVDCRVNGAGAMCPSCAQIPKPTDPDYTQTCAPMMDTTACYVCEDDHCCNTYAACHNNPECKATQTCVVNCKTDTLCQNACYLAHPNGFSDWRHRETCVLYFCSDTNACGTMPLDPCVKCQNLYCADENAACFHDLQCTLLYNCEEPCAPTDPACFTACQTKYPAGQTLLKAVIDCGTTQCMIACGGSG